ncbi:MAG: hypothetical protein H6719_33200 [Sandaracinaceae bacterium]|nr:hypothetical protein [Sandaracinaceae bacterium]
MLDRDRAGRLAGQVASVAPQHQIPDAPPAQDRWPHAETQSAWRTPGTDGTTVRRGTSPSCPTSFFPTQRGGPSAPSQHAWPEEIASSAAPRAIGASTGVACVTPRSRRRQPGEALAHAGHAPVAPSRAHESLPAWSEIAPSSPGRAAGAAT